MIRTLASAALLVLAAAAIAHEPALPLLSPTASIAGTAADPGRPQQPAGQTLPLRPTRRTAFDTNEGTWMSFDLSPDGRTIVFDLLGDLYTLPVTGGRARPIRRGMAFETQPTFSPDGRWIAYVSDRSGAENLWIARPDGGGARQISFGDDDTVLVSPAWSPDGRSLYVSRYRPSLNGYELWRHGLQGEAAMVVPVKTAPDQPSTGWSNSLGATVSPDGRTVYFARRVGAQDSDHVDEWTIVRRDIASGAESTIVAEPNAARKAMRPGAAFRPMLSPDGRLLAYATRFDGQTGLRLRDLRTGSDRWLAFPIARDQVQASAWQDLVPRYCFTPDGKAILISRKGGFERIDIATGHAAPIPFTAPVALELGPLTRFPVREESGPVRARVLAGPTRSPDGRSVAFSAFGSVHVAPLDGSAPPRRIAAGFHPAWSPDGRSLAWVSWTAREGGHIWVAAANGTEASRITSEADYYTDPVFTADGGTVLALRSSHAERLRRYMEYGKARPAKLIAIPRAGGEQRTILEDSLSTPQRSDRPDRAYALFPDGLRRIDLASGATTRVAQVVGPGWYFQDGPVPVDDLRISPDGSWLVAQIAQQLHLVAVPPAGKEEIDLSAPRLPHRRITKVGGDYFEWTQSGRAIAWSLGARLFERPLASITINSPERPGWSADTGPGLQETEIAVTLPRDVPDGSVLLAGARILTMEGDRMIERGDILVTRDRIAAIGPSGTVTAPPGTAMRDVAGKTIIPGLIDMHDHVADVRRDVQDLEAWGPRARLAYGVTTAFDPSTLTIDALSYQDMIDAGVMTGSRMPSTGTAIFSFNRIGSLEDARTVVRRYRDYYHLGNIKQYRAGNRRVRQWIAMAAAELGMVPTSEGALSMKLDLSQVIDGYSGNEHALVATPLYKDVITLMARSRTHYATTLQITNGGPPAEDYFITRDAPFADAKLNRFYPHHALSQMLLKRDWRPLSEYAFPAVARGAAQVQRAGGVVAIGSHGEMPGLGTHWEMEAHVMGGMRPMEVLRAATIGSAEAIGRAAEFGSIAPGKYADLIVLDADPRSDIRNARRIAQVMKGGRLYDGDTLDELWPRPRALGAPWFAGESPPQTP